MNAGRKRRIESLEVRLLLDEYRSLRDEISGALAAQHSVLSWGIAALALLVIAVASAWDKTPALICATLMTIVPGGIFLLLVVWGMELARMARAGTYLARYLEPRINGAAGFINATLAWEQWIRHKEVSETTDSRSPPSNMSNHFWRSRNLWSHHIIVGIVLSFFAVAAWTIGTYRLHSLSDASQEPIHPGVSRPVGTVPDVGSTDTRRSHWYFDHVDLETALLGVVFIVVPGIIGIWLTIDGRRKYSLQELPRNPYRSPNLQFGPPLNHDDEDSSSRFLKA